jgi:CheY-like chemotaxis protein
MKISDMRHCRCLVLDPFIASRRLLTDILMRDMKVADALFAVSIGDAMHRLQDSGVNVLFTDWSSEVDAIQLLQALRAPGSKHRHLPVVVLSTYNSIEHLRAARDAGMTEYMLKPFTAQAVQNRLRAIVQTPRSFVEAMAYFGPDRRRRQQGYDGGERRGSSAMQTRPLAPAIDIHWS